MKLTVGTAVITIENGSNTTNISIKSISDFRADGVSFFITYGGKTIPATVRYYDLTEYNGVSPVVVYATIATNIRSAMDNIQLVNVTQIGGNITTTSYTFVSDRDPLPSDDITHNFTTTSKWLNTVTDDLFECTSNASGAAVWKKIQYVNL